MLLAKLFEGLFALKPNWMYKVSKEFIRLLETSGNLSCRATSTTHTNASLIQSTLLVNESTMADESTRLGSRVDVGSLLTTELDDEVVVSLGRGACHRLLAFGPIGSSPLRTERKSLGWSDCGSGGR